MQFVLVLALIASISRYPVSIIHLFLYLFRSILGSFVANPMYFCSGFVGSLHYFIFLSSSSILQNRFDPPSQLWICQFLHWRANSRNAIITLCVFLHGIIYVTPRLSRVLMQSTEKNSLSTSTNPGSIPRFCILVSVFSRKSGTESPIFM